MTKLGIVSVGVLTILLAVILAVGSLGLAVREGAITEQTWWWPPRGKYQLIVRIGQDALPWAARWNSSDDRIAINVWAHGRGTEWHIIRLIRIPLGTRTETSR